MDTFTCSFAKWPRNCSPTSPAGCCCEIHGHNRSHSSFMCRRAWIVDRQTMSIRRTTFLRILEGRRGLTLVKLNIYHSLSQLLLFYDLTSSRATEVQYGVADTHLQLHSFTRTCRPLQIYLFTFVIASWHLLLKSGPARIIAVVKV
jgi:hypothetical protein